MHFNVIVPREPVGTVPMGLYIVPTVRGGNNMPVVGATHAKAWGVTAAGTLRHRDHGTEIRRARNAYGTVRDRHR